MPLLGLFGLNYLWVRVTCCDGPLVDLLCLLNPNQARLSYRKLVPCNEAGVGRKLHGFIFCQLLLQGLQFDSVQFTMSAIVKVSGHALPDQAQLLQLLQLLQLF